MTAFGAVCWSVRMDLSEIKSKVVQTSLQNDFSSHRISGVSTLSLSFSVRG